MALTPVQTLADVWAEALFLGLYLPTLFRCLRWLLWTDEGWKLRKKIDWTILIVTLLIAACVLIDKAVSLQSKMQSLEPGIVPQPQRGGTVNAPNWVDIVICTASNMGILLADAVLIFRLWHVYGKSLRIAILPILLWLGAFACTILQAYWQTVQQRGIQTSWHPINTTVGPGPILAPFWASTLVLNLYATPMIAFRIWRVTKDSAVDSQSLQSIRFVMRVLIESGFMYVVVTLSHFVVWWTPNTYAIAVVAALNIPMTGIGFNLILIRTAEKKAAEKLANQHLPTVSTSFKFTSHVKTSTIALELEDPSATTSYSESTAI
ncbi:hypothetical protein M422DRAFT_274244 [Sphaerobolus stellatus SS14]|uniref:Uncharacterized protein n=1 Tax=Sphaerobolus stellatus (strain SS14) TaxID=990650 RepID=A0A0C9UI62_SPHS4|nr:hypothetical protein M422DRAFT_274244 [Sphaerobolus stellatus SS14]